MSHTAEYMASSWRERRVAHINNRISGSHLLRIDIETQTEGRSQIDVSRASSTLPVKVRGERFFIPWRIVQRVGDRPILRDLARRTVNIASIPSTDPSFGHTGPIRPYADMLYRSGELELSVVDILKPDAPSDTFNLGQIVGLTILTQLESFPVWEPSLKT